MYAPSGSYSSEKCPEGIYVGHVHGLRCIGKHKNKWRPDDPPKVIGMFVVEIDKRNSKGRRFIKYKRESWTVNSKSNIRTKWGELIPESFEWSDHDWSQQDLEVIFNGLPCLVKIGDQGGMLSVRPLPQGKVAMDPEMAYEDVTAEDLSPVVHKERYEISESRVEDFRVTREAFAEPIPLKTAGSRVRKSPDDDAHNKEDLSEAFADEKPVETKTGDWDDENPRF